MIYMQRFLILFALILSTVAYGQTKKQPVIHYKTIDDRTFSVGERINVGEIEVVLLPLGKDSVVIPDSVEVYRDFVQNNRFMTFKLHMNWKLQGVKYPGRTDRTRDALLTYFNNDGTEQDSTCDITQFKHTFVKQGPVLQIELEVIDVKAPNMWGSHINGTIGMPEMNVLYRGYNNIIEVGVSGLPDRFWIEGTGLTLSASQKPGQFVARIAGTNKTASIAIKTVVGTDTTTIGTYGYRIMNLPPPSVFLGAMASDQLNNLSEEAFIALTRFYAKYTPEIPLKATFEIEAFSVTIGGKEILVSGSTLPEEYKKAYENAEKGSEIVFHTFKINGVGGKAIVSGPFKRIKQSEKGTKYTMPVTRESIGE